MTKPTITATVTLQQLTEQLIANPINVAYIPRKLADARPITDRLEQLVGDHLLSRLLTPGRERLKLTNGSTFAVTTPTGVRGNNFDLLVIDPDKELTATDWADITPATATTRGALITITLDKEDPQ